MLHVPGHFCLSANSSICFTLLVSFSITLLFTCDKKNFYRELRNRIDENTVRIVANWIWITNKWYFIFDMLYKWVFHDKEIWRISVRLSDRSEVTQHKINFVKTYPQWGLNPWPPNHRSNVLGRNLFNISEVSFILLQAPLHMLELCLFLESIEQDFIKDLMIRTDNQIVT